MYILLKEGKLRILMIKAIEKAGSYKTLSKEIKIPRSKIWSYQNHNIALKKDRLNKILDYIGEKITPEDIKKELPDNWRQIIGGKNCVKSKRKRGNLNRQLEQSRKNIENPIANWHKKMKKENPEKYYHLQYNNFKKIANYKFITKNGEKVRNILEKNVADLLQGLDLNYKYEPLIKIEDKYFFPDFIVEDRIIIECTMWRGYDKAVKLKEKIALLSKKYRVYVIIPKKLEKYYQLIKPYLITDLGDLKLLSNLSSSSNPLF